MEQKERKHKFFAIASSGRSRRSHCFGVARSPSKSPRLDVPKRKALMQRSNEKPDNNDHLPESPRTSVNEDALQVLISSSTSTDRSKGSGHSNLRRHTLKDFLLSSPPGHSFAGDQLGKANAAHLGLNYDEPNNNLLGRMASRPSVMDLKQRFVLRDLIQRPPSCIDPVPIQKRKTGIVSRNARWKRYWKPVLVTIPE